MIYSHANFKQKGLPFINSVFFVAGVSVHYVTKNGLREPKAKNTCNLIKKIVAVRGIRLRLLPICVPINLYTAAYL